MGYNILKLFNLLTLLLFINKRFCYGKFNILSSDIIEKNSNLLGIDLNYGYINFQLDDELVRYDTLACPNYNCTVDNSIITPNGTDCSCDYSDPTDCPKQLNIECGKSCPEFASDGTTPMCGDGNWEKINQSQQYIINSLNGEIKNFRYKANAKVCETLLIVVYPIVGFFRGSFGGSPINQRNLPSENVQTYNIMNICPTDNQEYTNTISYTKDTYYITIEPIQSNVTFSLQIYSNVTFTSPVEKTCNQLIENSKCVNDGEAFTDQIKGPAYNYYTFQIKKPDYYFFSAPALYQDVNLFISDDPSLPYPTISTPGKWQSVEEYDDYLVIYLEPINSTTPLTLYIAVYCSYHSNYTFAITSNGNYYPVKISTLPVSAGAYALTKTSRLILPDNTTYNCPSWYLCFPYSVQYPLQDGNPFWPVSTYFSSYETFQNIQFENVFLSNPFKSNSFQSSFLLSSQSDSTNPYIYQTFDIISNSKIEFLSTIFNSKGESLSGIYQLQIKNLTCNYEEFGNILDAVEKTEDILFSVTNLNDLNNWRYRLDSLTIRDGWIGCLNEAKSLLDTQIIKKNVSSIYCPYSSNDINYETDPCCNASLTFFQCCNPRNVEIPQTILLGTNNDLIKDQCSSYECTQSVLSDFYSSINSVDSCSVSSFSTQNLKLTVTQALRECKINTLYCSSDSDCTNFSSKKCDLFTRNCLIDFEILDQNYIECVLEKIPPSTLYYYIQVSPSNITSSIINQLYDQYLIDDCISESSYPLRQMLIYNSQDIPDGRCYPPKTCLDSTCELEHDVCFDQVYTNFQKYPWLDLYECGTIGYCPILQSDCGQVNYDNSQCSQQCNSITNYCGYCTNNETYCHHINEYDASETQCSTNSACLLPNGQYQLGVSKEECELLGMCTGYCGYSCGAEKGCLITSAQTQTQCSTHSNSIWSNDICIYNTLNSTLCSINGYSWLDCSSKSVGECSGPTLNTLNFCSLTPISCNDESSCVSQGGICSDLNFFLQENTQQYSSGLGKCVRGHFEYRSGFYPSCNFDNENDGPMGCYSHQPKFLTKSSCESAGYHWWIPSINKTQCTEKKGCKTLDLNSDNLPFNFRFNQMDEELCNGCFQSQNKWTNMFDWTPAQWIPGVYVDNLQWNQNQFKLIAKNKKAFGYELFHQDMMNVVNTQIADLLRSESFCRLERIQSNLNSVACSCGEGNSLDDPSICFQSSVPLLGQSKPCFGEESFFNFGYGELIFSQNSILSGCPSLLISQFSKENFMAAIPESLSSNFVNYNVIDKYGVLNEKDAIVGILIEDGIGIKSQFSNIKQLTVCFKVDRDYSNSKYPTYDFASTNQNEKPYPLNVEIFQMQSKNSDSVLFCSNFTQDFISDLDQLVLFPIARKDNWENKNRQVFSSSTAGLLYTLATLYLIITLWGLFQLGFIFYHQRKSGIFKVQLAHLLILIVTIFILMRSIYFYILPNGHLAFNPVGDYILVILPTFIYFTAFTTIIVLWYVLVFLTYRSTQNVSKRIFKMVLIINAIIYLLFVACCLVFKKTQNIPTNDCGSRIIVPISSSIPQKSISIAYAVVQFVISLVLGATFIYLGTSLYFIMKRTKKALAQTANDDIYKRIFLQTLICSIGFVLHCIFILVLVTGKLNTIGFSFPSLIITEIIPTITILYCYDPRHKLPKKEISMNSSHNYTSGDS